MPVGFEAVFVVGIVYGVYYTLYVESLNPKEFEKGL